MKSALLAAALSLSASAALAFEPSEVVIQVGYSAGGTYDATARVVADHLPAHLPGNPTTVVQNLPGAGSLKLARLFAQTAPTDGSTLAVIGNSLALTPVFEPDTAGFAPDQVRYVGTMSNEASYCYTVKSSGITTFDQLLADPQAKVGATGKSSSTYIYAAALKRLFEGQFQIVVGFEGGAEIDLALERGDIQARCGATMSGLVRGGLIERVNVLAELSADTAKATGQGEFLIDRLTDPAKRAAFALILAPAAIHHPFVVPAATPEPVLTELRAAFAALATDPAFLADAKAWDLTIEYTPGDQVEARIAELLAAPPEVKALARDLAQ